MSIMLAETYYPDFWITLKTSPATNPCTSITQINLYCWPIGCRANGTPNSRKMNSSSPSRPFVEPGLIILSSVRLSTLPTLALRLRSGIGIPGSVWHEHHQQARLHKHWWYYLRFTIISTNDPVKKESSAICVTH